MWRIVTQSLATGEALTRRHIISDSQCKRCCAAPETLERLFFGCHYVQAIWRGSPVSHTAFFNPHLPFEDKFRLILQCCTDTRQDHITRQIPLWMLWHIWKSRNLLVYQRKGSNWQDDVQKAITDSYEWIPLQRDTQRRSPNDRSGQGWPKPIHGFIKCNYDCSFSRNDLAPKAGWILRIDTCSYLLAAQGTGQLCNSVLEAELQALLMAMQHT
ncbi:putative ribonuclease H domain, reverse transcriptase zinc-binding domain-containing protein [Arabidopsis thaliana]